MSATKEAGAAFVTSKTKVAKRSSELDVSDVLDLPSGAIMTLKSVDVWQCDRLVRRWDTGYDGWDDDRSQKYESQHRQAGNNNRFVNERRYNKIMRI
jgi:hypothetical protein